MTDSAPRKSIAGNIGDHNNAVAIGEQITQTITQNFYTHPLAEDGFDLVAVEQRYRDQVVHYYNKLALTGLPERDPGLHEITLEHVFVKLNVKIAKTMASYAHGDLHSDNFFVDHIDEVINVDLQRTPIDHYRITNRSGFPAAGRLATKSTTLSIADALHRSKRLVVIGGPGSGKTTLTRWLAVIFARQEQGDTENLGERFATPRLPILLELRRFAQRFAHLGQDPAVPDLALEIANYIASSAVYAGTPAPFIIDALNAGRCLLILDGLDEIADLAARQLLIQALQAFLQQTTAQRDSGQRRDNLCLLTSRPHGYLRVGVGGGFLEAEVQPFVAEDVQRFINHWYAVAYGADAKDEANALVAAIESNDRVGALATNPLLCTIVAIVYRNNRVLPNRRVDLYLKCCEVLLDTWERNKAIKESGLIGGYDWQMKLELLAPIAYWLHSEEERLAAPEDAFVSQLAAVLLEKRLASEALAYQEARHFIATIRDRSGLLQGRGDGMLEFIHRTFQEYLTARYIAAQPHPDYIDMVMVHLHKAWWREVHLLVIGYLGSGCSDAEKNLLLLNTILDCCRPPCRLLRAYYPVTAKWYHFPALHKCIGRYVSCWQLERRLAWMLQREVALAINGYLDCAELGKTSQLRERIGNAAAMFYLRIAFDTAAPTQHIVGLADALGTAEEGVVDVLLKALGATEGPVRAAAARALGGLVGTEREHVVKALLIALGDSDTSVRFAAVDALSWLDEARESVVTMLLSTLKYPDMFVRAEAVSKLEELGKGNDSVIAALLDALGDTEWLVRSAVVRALGKLGDQNGQVIDALLSVLNDPDILDSSEIAEALSQLGAHNKRVTEELLLSLDNMDKTARATAIDALGRLAKGNEIVVVELCEALNDSDRSVRLAAIRALGRAGEKNEIVITGLCRVLSNQNEAVRYAAADALGELGDASVHVIDTLRSVLGNPDVSLRIAAARALSKLGKSSEAVVTTLLSALGSSDMSMRAVAARTLGELGQSNDHVIAVLIRDLTNSIFASSRAVAANNLGKLQIKDYQNYYNILTYLNRHLHDSCHSVHWSSLLAIRTLIDGRQLPGYHWVPLKERQDRRRRLYAILNWIVLLTGLIFVAFGLTYLDSESRLIQLITVLGGLIGIGAGIAQIVGGTLRNPWERDG